jgi:hypothetical protein
MLVSDVGYYSSLLRQREMMMPQLTEDEAEMVEMGPYYGMRGIGQDESGSGSGTPWPIIGVAVVAVAGILCFVLCRKK